MFLESLQFTENNPSVFRYCYFYVQHSVSCYVRRVVHLQTAPGRGCWREVLAAMEAEGGAESLTQRQQNPRPSTSQLALSSQLGLNFLWTNELLHSQGWRWNPFKTKVIYFSFKLRKLWRNQYDDSLCLFNIHDLPPFVCGANTKNIREGSDSDWCPTAWVQLWALTSYVSLGERHHFSVSQLPRL